MWTKIEIVFKDKQKENKVLFGVESFHSCKENSLGPDVYIRLQYRDGVGYVKLEDIDSIIVHYV